MGASSLQMDKARAEQLIRLLTDGLVNIDDKDGSFTYTLPDGKTPLNTVVWTTWEWTQGVALTALYRNDPDSPAAQHSIKVALDWFEDQYKRTDGKAAPKNINTVAPFYCLSGLLLDGITKDPRWLSWCEEWAEWLMDGLPRTQERGFQHSQSEINEGGCRMLKSPVTYLSMHEQQMWDDTLMMSVVPLARMGVLLQRPYYVQEAIAQFLLHAQYLVHPPSGLWYHGWQFEAGSGHNFAKALWARGNCWITLAIPIFLSILVDGGHLTAEQLQDGAKNEDAVARFLISTYRRQVNSLVKLQDEKTGMWHTLLVDPTSYVETSATAGFAAGIYMGLRMGILSDPAGIFRACADWALQGVLDNIRPNGEVDKVSFGTGMGPDLQFYKDIPIIPMPYGQALAMMALVEWEKINGQ